jgi:signal transduction histidine kinase
MTNAAVHGDGTSVSVYGEADGGVARVYVRDRGPGFDPVVARGRHGISESILGRIEAVGGTAELRSEPGRGTEWKLEVAM